MTMTTMIMILFFHSWPNFGGWWFQQRQNILPYTSTNCVFVYINYSIDIPTSLVHISCTKIISRDGDREREAGDKWDDEKICARIRVYIQKRVKSDISTFDVIVVAHISLFYIPFPGLCHHLPSSIQINAWSLSVSSSGLFKKKDETFFLSLHKIHFISYQKRNFKLFFVIINL